MFNNPSLITRIAIGKGLGALIGFIIFFMIPYLAPETSLMLRWGIVLWYTTMGAIIGVFGVFTWHPILKLPMPWWFRAPLLGGWLNFTLVFFAYDEFARMTHAIFGEGGLMLSPFWAVLEGALVGLFIGFFATHFGGEGAITVSEDESVS